MQADPRPPSLFTQLASDRRVTTMLGLGFSQGLPLLLVFATQSAWLSEVKVPMHTIGLMSEMTLAYKFKFVWAPFLDRYDAPVLGRLLGRRRGWIVVAQILVIATLVAIAFGDPAHRLGWTIAFSVALGFAGATQDVAVDGWRIAVAPDKRAVMTSWAEIGWRIGTFAAGAGALFLADKVGWRGAYLCMAVVMVPCLVTTLLAPVPEADGASARPPSRRRRSSRNASSAFVDHVVTPIWVPIKDLVMRLGPMAAPILLMVAGFRMAGYISSVMEIPLFVHLHYTNTDIATVTKLFGFWVALAATVFGGWLVPRIGMMASLLAGTLTGSISHLALAWLAAHGDHGGHEFWTFAIAVSIDSFAYAFASIVLITYMSTLCANELAASQYALLTSLVALPGSLLAASSGFVIERLGFTQFFVGTSLIGLPVALLCWWVWWIQDKEPRAVAA